jgi:hypothetical protein
MSTPLLGVSLQPRWPVEDETAVLRAASHAEDLRFDHVAVGNRLLDSGSGLDTDPLVLLSAVSAALDVISGRRLILGGSPSPPRHSLLRRASPQRCRHRDRRSAAPRP